MSGEWETVSRTTKKDEEVAAVKAAIKNNSGFSSAPAYHRVQLRKYDRGQNSGRLKDVIVYFRFKMPSGIHYVIDLHYDYKGNYKSNYDHIMTDDAFAPQNLAGWRGTFTYHSDSSGGVVVKDTLRTSLSTTALQKAKAAVGASSLSAADKSAFGAGMEYFDELDHFDAYDAVYGQQYAPIGYDQYDQFHVEQGPAHSGYLQPVQVHGGDSMMTVEWAALGLMAMCIVAMMMLVVCVVGTVCGWIGASVYKDSNDQNRKYKLVEQMEAHNV